MIAPLTNPIRPYAWGSRTAIAELLGEPSPAARPQAEMWLGAHPDDPSLLADGTSLQQWIAADPPRRLGPATVHALGPQLPFLMKVLAAAAPLSLQVHPTTEQAWAGYDEENGRGIAQDAAERNYRDRQHKPELICATTTFIGLAGFRPVRQTLAVLDGLDVDALADHRRTLAAAPDSDGLRTVVERLLSGSADVRGAVAGIAAACARSGDFPLERKWIGSLSARYPDDAGVVVALLMNLVVLEPGEAIFLPAGVLHSYLDGIGIEVLASSDNVLRGGLTSKHVDVPELLRVLDTTPRPPPVVLPRRVTDDEVGYDVPAREFRLSCLDLDGEAALSSELPQILLVTAGKVRLEQGATAQTLGKGKSAYVDAGGGELRCRGAGTVYRCTPNLAAAGVP